MVSTTVIEFSPVPALAKVTVPVNTLFASNVIVAALASAVNVAAPAADWLNQQGENLTAAQKQLVADTTRYIAANPLKSVAIALAAGFVISRIVR